MSTRAEEHGAEIVIADATVFYEEVKRFAKFFDKHIRVATRPKLRRMPFEAEEGSGFFFWNLWPGQNFTRFFSDAWIAFRRRHEFL